MWQSPVDRSHLVGLWLLALLVTGCPDERMDHDDIAPTGSDTTSTDTVPTESDTASLDTDDALRDAGRRCDAALELPAPTPDAFGVAPIDAGRIAIDGHLTEAGPRALTVSADGDSDNTFRIAARWTARHLYLAIEVTDDTIAVDDDIEVWNRDSIEIGFDPGGDSGGLSGDELKWLVDASGNRRVGHTAPGHWAPVENDVEGEHAATSSEDGYRVEMTLPLSRLGLDATAGQSIPFVAINNDRDGSDVSAFSMADDRMALNSPGTWGTLELADSPCRSNGGDTGSADGGPAPDTEPSGRDTSPADDTGPSGRTYECDHRITEEGADDTGDEPIDAVLERLAGPNKTICFAPGTYRLDSFTSSHDGLELVGGDATIVPTPRDSTSRLLTMRGRDWVVDGFEFDYRQVEEAPKIAPMGPDGWELRHIVIRGKNPTAHRHNHRFTPAVTSAGGTGLMRRVYVPDGAAPPDTADNTTCVWLGPNNKGTLRFDGLWLEHCPNNTVYASNSIGRIEVKNSFFRNNNNGALRLGATSVVDNSTFVKDGGVPIQKWSGAHDARAVWANGNKSNGRQGRITIKNSDIVWTDSDGAANPLNFLKPSTETVIDDVRIRVETGGPAILVGDRTGPTDLTLRDVQITGTTTAPAIRVSETPDLQSVSGCVSTGGPISDRDDVASQLSSSNCETASDAAPIPVPPPVGQTPRPLPTKK